MFRMCTLILAGMLAATAPARADADAEKFVATNLQQVIDALSNAVDESARKDIFDQRLSSLIDMRRVGRFVIGRYGRSLEDEDLDRYLGAFEEYLQAVYYQRIRQYSQARFRVIGSVDIKPGDSVVKTEIRPSQDAKLTRIDWRVRRNKDGVGYKILDMALRVQGNQLWLAQAQRSQFMVILDQGDGMIDALITKMQEISTKENRKYQ